MITPAVISSSAAASADTAGGLSEMLSRKAVAPMTMLTTGSTTVIMGSETSSVPAWNALWDTSIPTTPPTASTYGCQCSSSTTTPDPSRCALAAVNAAEAP